MPRQAVGARWSRCTMARRFDGREVWRFVGGGVGLLDAMGGEPGVDVVEVNF